MLSNNMTSPEQATQCSIVNKTKTMLLLYSIAEGVVVGCLNIRMWLSGQLPQSV